MHISLILPLMKEQDFSPYELGPLIDDDTDLNALISEIKLNYPSLEEPLFYILLHKNPEYISKLSLKTLYNIYWRYMDSNRIDIIYYCRTPLEQAIQDAFASFNGTLLIKSFCYSYNQIGHFLPNSKTVFYTTKHEILFSHDKTNIIKDIIEGNLFIIIDDDEKYKEEIWFEYSKPTPGVTYVTPDIRLYLTLNDFTIPFLSFRDENEELYYYNYVGGFEKLKYKPIIIIKDKNDTLDTLLQKIKVKSQGGTT